MKRIFSVCILALITVTSFAKQCNRTDRDSSDYIEPYEICDDDFYKKKIPQFSEYFVAETSNPRPIFPSKISGAAFVNVVVASICLRQPFAPVLHPSADSELPGLPAPSFSSGNHPEN